MDNLKILHINTFQFGGSGVAAMRLHKALRKNGYDSKFLFLEKGTASDTEVQFARRRDWWIFILRVLKKLGLPFTTEQRNDYLIRKYKYDVEMFSFANTANTNMHEHPLVKESDIIHLHWISNFVDFRSFFGHINKPVVWTLHDMNGFMGGFHYQDDEKKFGVRMNALDEHQKAIKRESLRQLRPDRLSIITPSHWLYNLSKQSDALGRFQHYHIPNGVDTNIFKRQGQKIKTGKDKIKVLFAAESLHNYRKGFDIALEVLKDKDVLAKCHFMAIGYVEKSSRIPNITYYGIIKSEERMSELYNEADIFLLPSREDNLPNCMVESLCCGTPVVGFAIGGLPETITEGFNGYLSEEMSSAGLKQALLTCIENIETFSKEAIAGDAHQKYASEVQVKAVGKLYHHMLQSVQEKIYQ